MDPIGPRNPREPRADYPMFLPRNLQLKLQRQAQQADGQQIRVSEEKLAKVVKDVSGIMKDIAGHFETSERDIEQEAKWKELCEQTTMVTRNLRKLDGDLLLRDQKYHLNADNDPDMEDEEIKKIMANSNAISERTIDFALAMITRHFNSIDPVRNISRPLLRALHNAELEPHKARIAELEEQALLHPIQDSQYISGTQMELRDLKDRLQMTISKVTREFEDPIVALDDFIEKHQRTKWALQQLEGDKRNLEDDLAGAHWETKQVEEKLKVSKDKFNRNYALLQRIFHQNISFRAKVKQKDNSIKSEMMRCRELENTMRIMEMEANEKDERARYDMDKYGTWMNWDTSEQERLKSQVDELDVLVIDLRNQLTEAYEIHGTDQNQLLHIIRELLDGYSTLEHSSTDNRIQSEKDREEFGDKIQVLERISRKKEEELAAQSAVLRATEKDFSAQSAILLATEKGFAVKSVRLQEKEDELAAQSLRLQETEKELAGQSVKLREKTKELATQSNKIREQDVVITRLEDETSWQNERMENMQTRISGQRDEIRLKDADLAKARNDFQEISANYNKQNRIVLELQTNNLIHSTTISVYLAETKELREKLNNKDEEITSISVTRALEAIDMQKMVNAAMEGAEKISGLQQLIIRAETAAKEQETKIDECNEKIEALKLDLATSNAIEMAKSANDKIRIAEQRMKEVEKERKIEQGKVTKATEDVNSARVCVLKANDEVKRLQLLLETKKVDEDNTNDKVKMLEAELNTAKAMINNLTRSISPPESPLIEKDGGPSYKKRRLENSTDITLKAWQNVCNDFNCIMSELRPIPTKPIDNYGARLAIERIFTDWIKAKTYFNDFIVDKFATRQGWKCLKAICTEGHREVPTIDDTEACENCEDEPCVRVRRAETATLFNLIEQRYLRG